MWTRKRPQTTCISTYLSGVCKCCNCVKCALVKANLLFVYLQSYTSFQTQFHMNIFADDQFTLILELVESNQTYAIFYNGQNINFIKVDVLPNPNIKRFPIKGIIGIFDSNDSPNPQSQLSTSVNHNMTSFYLCVLIKASTISPQFDLINKIQFIHIPKKPSQWIQIDHLLSNIIDSSHPMYELDLYINQSPFYRSNDPISLPSKYFLWNLSSLKSLIHLSDLYDFNKPFVLVYMCLGFIDSIKIPINPISNILLTITSLSTNSRLKRGISDNGNCANHIHSTLSLSITNSPISYQFVLIRASPPLFFDSKIMRPIKSTTHAATLHFNQIASIIPNIHIFNLLDQSGFEQELTGQYEQLISALSNDFNLSYSQFQYNALIKSTNDLPLLHHLLNPILAKCSYSSSTQSQAMIIRLNDFDMIERTNTLHHVIFQCVLDLICKDNPIFKILQTNQSALNQLFTNHNNSISILYSGSTRSQLSAKSTLNTIFDQSMKLANQIKSQVTRDNTMIIHWFLNNRVLLGNPQLSKIRNKMDLSKYTVFHEISLFCMTWNVNNQLPNADLMEIRTKNDGADILVIGIQELIELTPDQILQPDQLRIQLWLNKLTQLLPEYHVIRYAQLVGTALFVLVKDLTMIGHLEVRTRKTGLNGMAGNKGGILMKIRVWDTTIVVMTSHLAHGQDGLAQRNSDYASINQSLANWGLRDTTPVLWCGDFNYRLDYYENGQIRQMVKEGDLETLLKYDQLTNQMTLGTAFAQFMEHPITFNPTYKYDNGTDTYDTSEKMRKPAWTDRIVYKGQGIGCVGYGVMGMNMSDHKGVYGMYCVRVGLVDKGSREKEWHGHLEKEKRQEMLIDVGGVGHIKEEETTIKRRMSMTNNTQRGKGRPELPKRGQRDLITEMVPQMGPELPSRKSRSTEVLVDLESREPRRRVPEIPPKPIIKPEIPPKPILD